MGKIHESITPKLSEFIQKQKLFFVSTAPLSDNGLINNSPKGLDSFCILDKHTVAYIDLVGSGVETIAHLKENGRITIMFCAFEGAPKILRLYGKGEVLERDTASFEAMQHHFPDYINARSIIKIKVQRIQDACGYAVPILEFKQERDVLDKWAANKGTDGIKTYIRKRNSVSLDGMKGVE
ncbi:MAG: hypothetical protein ACI9XO_001430 [Paraglaciecola sp.]|jgi:hypothetical protein